MSNIEPTTATKVMMLGHIIAGKDLDFVAGVTGLSRDTVLDVVSAHGYPKINSMKWSVDCLIKDTNKIPTRQADHRPRVLLDEPAAATPARTAGGRPSNFALIPPVVIAHVPPATADLLRQASESPWIRTQNIGTKISALLADLTARLADEQAAAEAKARVAHENALVASQIATLQAEIDKLKRKPAKTAKAAAEQIPSSAGQATPDSAVIRSWAWANNIDCPKTGTVNKTVRDAYHAANPTPRKAIA